MDAEQAFEFLGESCGLDESDIDEDVYNFDHDQESESEIESDDMMKK